MYSNVQLHILTQNYRKFGKIQQENSWRLGGYDMGSRPRRAELLWCRFVKDKLMLKFEWNMVQIEVVMMMTFCNGIGMFSWRCIWRKYFYENLRWPWYTCSGNVVICTSAYFDTILQEIWECSAREQLEAGWIMTWGQGQGGQNSFDVEKGTFLQDKLDLDCKISKMCLKLEM